MSKEYSTFVTASGFWNQRIKYYPDGTEKHTFAVDTAFYVGRKTEKTFTGKHVERKQLENNSRAKVQVFDLAFCNKWDWFVTLTLSDEYVNRYDYDDCSAAVSKFTKFLGKSKSNSWLIVPEMHLDGAYHFHGLISGPLNAMIAINPWGFPIRDIHGRQVYNLSDYRFGFTTATEVENSEAAAYYITKYFTKGLSSYTDELGVPVERARQELQVPKGKKRYWASRNLNRPNLWYDHYLQVEFNDVVSGAKYVNSTKLKKGTIIYADYDVEYAAAKRFVDLGSDTPIPDFASPLFNKIFILLTNHCLYAILCL